MKRFAALFLCLALPAAPRCHDYTMFPPGARANALGTAFSTVTDDPYAVFYNPANLTALNAGTIQNVGGSQAHLNMQPFLTLSFCIALQGIFPSQN